MLSWVAAHPIDTRTKAVLIEVNIRGTYLSPIACMCLVETSWLTPLHLRVKSIILALPRMMTRASSQSRIAMQPVGFPKVRLGGLEAKVVDPEVKLGVQISIFLREVAE